MMNKTNCTVKNPFSLLYEYSDIGSLSFTILSTMIFIELIDC